MNPTRVVELVMELDDEIDNGGFHQYFNNSSGSNSEETIEALEVIGAKASAELLRQAAGMFPSGMPPRNRKERLQLLREYFPRTDEFREWDTKFLAYPDDLPGRLIAFKSRFPESFRE